MSEELKDVLKEALREVLSELKEEVSDKPKVKCVQRKKKKVAKKTPKPKKTVKKQTPLQKLKAEAKSLGIKGYSTMKKADLQSAIDEVYKGPDPAIEQPEGWTFISDRNIDLDPNDKRELDKAKKIDAVSPKHRSNFFGTRKKSEKVEMICRTCNKKEMVSPAFARYPTEEDRQEGWNPYLCNRCSGPNRKSEDKYL